MIRIAWLTSLLLVAVMAFGSPARAFKAGGWEGQANNDDNGKFRDCTMTAEYKNGITLVFLISRDFEWGLSIGGRCARHPDPTREFRPRRGGNAAWPAA
jgi:hypothetical protein